MSLLQESVTGALNILLGGAGLQGIQRLPPPIDGPVNVTATDETISQIATKTFDSQHAPADTGQTSPLSGRHCARVRTDDADYRFMGAPVSSDRANETKSKSESENAENGIKNRGSNSGCVIA